ncbi:hypothetical protein GIB67_025971 [Kingdonia uniflora]|uniref:10 kDa chaperonin n=1 Tax=Kingdonia uniflora TaxID=39325 RepID=A0A7J7L8B8_9MAGN|nr:hypothetical protein GIB67_025971 [Kingdonia uniflora]
MLFAIFLSFLKSGILAQGCLYLSFTTFSANSESDCIHRVIAVGPGSVDEEGKKKLLTVAAGNTVLYSKYDGNDFKGTDGTEYIALTESDILAVLINSC